MSEFARESKDDYDEEPAKIHRRQTPFCLCVKFHNHNTGWEAKMRREGNVNSFRMRVVGSWM